MDVRLRPASTDDLAGLRRLFADTLDREPVHRAALVDLLFTRVPELRLVAVDAGELIGAAFGTVHDDVGYLDAITVAAARRGQGVATALVGELEARLRVAGAGVLRIGGNPVAYAWPGLDLQYTAALCAAERLGYRRIGTAQNMTVDLSSWVPSDRPSVDVRRAQAGDERELTQFVAAQFDPPWLDDTRRALARRPPPLFVAVRDGRIVGFACHGVNRADWFGPLGVGAEARGLRLGEALLRRCLDEMAAAGLAAAQIAWVGPIRFYSRAVGARCERTFALLEK